MTESELAAILDKYPLVSVITENNSNELIIQPRCSVDKSLSHARYTARLGVLVIGIFLTVINILFSVVSEIVLVKMNLLILDDCLHDYLRFFVGFLSGLLFLFLVYKILLESGHTTFLFHLDRHYLSIDTKNLFKKKYTRSIPFDKFEKIAIVEDGYPDISITIDLILRDIKKYGFKYRERLSLGSFYLTGNNDTEHCSRTEYIAVLTYHEAMMQTVRKALRTSIAMYNNRQID
jgi:hypothetical protein